MQIGVSAFTSAALTCCCANAWAELFVSQPPSDETNPYQAGAPAALAWRIGWVSGGDLFLEPRASYDVAQEMAGPELLPMGEQVIRNRLRQRGFLINVDVGLQMPQVRRPLEG